LAAGLPASQSAIKEKRLNDDHPPEAPGTVRDHLSGIVRTAFIMGLRFYTRLPSGSDPHAPPELNRIALVLPAVSLVIGLGPALLLMALVLAGVPGIFAAGLATALLLVVTGAMPEDGLADAADGLFGGATSARRLEIMRDSTHGTYGVLALVLFILLRVVAVGAVASFDPLGAAGMWLAATLVARSGALWLVVALPPARPDGLSASVGGVTRANYVVGLVLAVIVAVPLAWLAAGLWGIVAAAVLCGLVAAGWTAVCRRLAGGQTGDLIGALQALLELAALTAFLAFA